jgi:two-component system sensor histidine kinase BaeS
LRTRLVASILLVALGVLGISYAATFVLVRRSLEQNALDNLKSRADDFRTTADALITNDALAAGRPLQKLAGLRAQLKTTLRLTDVRALYVDGAGNVTSPGPAEMFQMPPKISAADLLPRALLQNQLVTGRRGNTVFLAEPVRPVANGKTLVVVATDSVATKVLARALPLMFLVGVIVLGAAFAVALWLERRLTRPIRAIEGAAARIATGDLGARADVPPTTDDELAALAGTLNTMAAQLEQARGSERAFLLSISHDLRTPLTSIRGYAEALADGTLDDGSPEDRKRAAAVIGAEARRLERLVRDLLDLSRLDSRQFSLQPRPCDATEIVHDAADAFAPQAHDLGIELVITQGSVLPVDADPERLAQIVANLVENALKYAATRVEVYAAPHGPSGVAIVVVDDGPGIPADQLALVFDRLYTVRETPGRAVGTGLGLAIVRELAAAMGGRAWAEAVPEGGSRFVVSLPTSVRATAS